MTRGDHSKDVEPKGQKYIEVDEPITERETGNFFLTRYQSMDPGVTVIDRDTLKSAIRVNTEKVTHEELRMALARQGAFLERVPFLKNGYYTRSRFSLGSTAEYLLGHYYVQAPLSQLVCELLDPLPGSEVLDMAAAPGGKTTYLATLVGDTGTVIALDPNATRLAAVRNNVERLGIKNVLCVKKDARFAADLGKTFAYVLLDAPCSGNYCSEENWFGRRTLQDVRENSRTQRELLRAAYQCLAPGGKLLYSTCSLEPEEDELAISWALGKFKDIDLIPLNTDIGSPGITSWDGEALDPRVAGTRRFWPHKTGLEGFYMALLTRKAS